MGAVSRAAVGGDSLANRGRIRGPCVHAQLQDQHDEWQDGRRRFSQQSMARLLHPGGPLLLTNPLTGDIAA
jgi:hypothetical protein